MKTKLVKLFKELAISYGEFLLSSGERSSYFVDASKVILHGDGISLITDIIWWDIMESHNLVDVTVFGGVMTGADPLIGSLLFLAHMEAYSARGFLVRKDGKIEGSLNPGDEVLLIDDVITTGTQVLNAASKVEENGGKVAAIISVVDRLAGAKERIESSGYKYLPILNIKDLEINV